MPESDRFRRWRVYGLALLVLPVLYVVWVGTSGILANRAFERAAQARQAAPLQPLPEAGPGVKILHFYASAGELFRGDHAVICYGVQNASAVRLEPPVEEITPSRNRCIAVEPQKTTTYTLRVMGADGAEVSESFTIRVNPPPPKILFVAINKTEFRRGEPLAICYGVVNASSVRLDPLGWDLKPGEKMCVQTFAVATVTYTLTATGAEGRIDSEKFKITVK